MRTFPASTPSWAKPLITAGYILLIGLMTLYVGWRLDRWIFASFRLDFSFGLTVLLGLFFLLHIGTAHRFLVAWDKCSTYLCGVGTFLLIYLTVGFGAVDIWAVLTHRRADMDLVRSSGRWVLLLVALLAIFSFLWRKVILVQTLSFPLTDAPCRVVLLSDLHIGYYVGLKHIRKLVKLVNAQQPDYVVIAGDLINAGNVLECSKIDQVAKALSAIQAPVFAVLGNHDPEADNQELKDFLESAKINLLEDDVLHADRFELVGRTSCTRERKTIGEILPEPNGPVIVLDHDPQGIAQAAEAGADLVLCGHTHDGQVFPLNLFVRAVYDREETYGRGRRGDTYSYVTSGAGYFSMPMRLGSFCEIAVLDLLDTRPKAPEAPAPEESPAEEPAPAEN